MRSLESGDGVFVYITRAAAVLVPGRVAGGFPEFAMGFELLQGSFVGETEPRWMERERKRG
ncbi:hypothetical protein E2C01_038600 [Portunus trituberculatus]|uniref:Uncharacterized protein n=1 Tax=Portunus trituberculatus TaxID=210409 RepID=A0A5B7FIY8_PORTR|nr:hypothetical protein [Portunus trituberculatus]